MEELKLRRTMCALEYRFHLAQHLSQFLSLKAVSHVSFYQCTSIKDILGSSVKTYLGRAGWTLELRNMVFGLFGQIDRIGPCSGSPKEKSHLVLTLWSAQTDVRLTTAHASEILTNGLTGSRPMQSVPFNSDTGQQPLKAVAMLSKNSTGSSSSHR
jgi:hypothetical protein